MFGWRGGVDVGVCIGVGDWRRRKWRRTDGGGSRCTPHGKRGAVCTVADGGKGGYVQPYVGVRPFLLLVLGWMHGLGKVYDGEVEGW